MENKMTLHEWLQTTYLSLTWYIDIVEHDGQSYCHKLTGDETVLKTGCMFAKKFSEVTYKELQPYLDLVYEDSYIYERLSGVIIVEVKVKAKEKEKYNV